VMDAALIQGTGSSAAASPAATSPGTRPLASASRNANDVA